MNDTTKKARIAEYIKIVDAARSHIGPHRPDWDDPEDEAQWDGLTELMEFLAALSEKGRAGQVPDGYHYRYATPDGGSVIRKNNGGEVNGSRPIEAVPYWYAAPAAGQAPEYTSAMGDAANRYHASFKYAHQLPVQWRWEELWAAMLAAAKEVE